MSRRRRDDIGLRQLPSGKWQATVWLPNGTRTTKTFRLKTEARAWRDHTKADVDRGEYIDPHARRIKVGEWYEQWSRTRVLESATRRRHESLWRNHCAPQWANWPLNAVTRHAAREWVNRLRNTPSQRQPHDGTSPRMLTGGTIRAIVYLMSSMFEAALEESLVRHNPFTKLELPKAPIAMPRFFEAHHAQALYRSVEKLFGRRWRVAIELGMMTGLRPGELCALHAHQVDWMRRQIKVTQIVAEQGALRQYPKTSRSQRTVPIPPHLCEDLARLREGEDNWGACVCPQELPDGTVTPGSPCPGLLFPNHRGELTKDWQLRKGIWYPALEAARTCGRLGVDDWDECRTSGCGDPRHRLPRYSPHAMRHTAASWLAQDGVPVMDLRDLLGHVSVDTTLRYAHLGPDAYKRILRAWAGDDGQDLPEVSRT